MIRELRLGARVLAAVVFLAFAVAPMAAKGGFQEEHDKLLKAAQKEGQLQAFICCGLGRGIGKIMPEFEKKYKIKVTFSTGSSREQSPKVLAERRAGRYTLDVWMGGLNPAIPTLIPAGALKPLRPMLFFPETLNNKAWYEGRMHWFDRQKKYLVGFRGNASKADITYNTKLVDPKEIQSYYDLLNPKWKGKIIMRDPRTVGVSGSTAFFYISLGGKWLRRFLTEMDVTVTTNARQAGEKLALGKYAFCMFACANEVRRLKREGHPVENAFPHYLKESSRLSPGGGALYVMDRAPHPNAQKFFANWWLSRAGQIMMQRGSGDHSLREDIPLDSVFPDNRREKGHDYLMIGSQDDYQELLARAMVVTRKALTSVGK